MYNGIMPLYKPHGITSHDAIYELRKRLKMKKIGHTGTLDPDVDGVLPICLGNATRVAEYITDGQKIYKGIIRLGWSTTTEDASGETIEEKPVTASITRTEVLNAFRHFTGDITQIPPMYSAVKVNGKKLYEYAREGKDVKRPERQVTIYEIKLLSEAASFETDIPFEVTCGKGTYVRTLAVEIGAWLGYPAHLNQLTRTRSGGYSLEDCHTLSEIEAAEQNGTVQALLAPIEKALERFQKWTAMEDVVERVQNGARLPFPNDYKNEPIAVYNKDGQCLALYRKHPDHPDWMKPDKVFRPAHS